MIKLTLRPLTFSHVEMPWITRVRRFHSPFIYGAGSRRVVNGRAALTPTSWASEVCTLESLVNVSLVCEDISLEDLENNTHPQLMSSLLTFLSSSRNQYLQDSVPHLETCCLKWSYGHAYLRRNAPFPKKTKTERCTRHRSSRYQDQVSRSGWLMRDGVYSPYHPSPSRREGLLGCCCPHLHILPSQQVSVLKSNT